MGISEHDMCVGTIEQLKSVRDAGLLEDSQKSLELGGDALHLYIPALMLSSPAN